MNGERLERTRITAAQNAIAGRAANRRSAAAKRSQGPIRGHLESSTGQRSPRMEMEARQHLIEMVPGAARAEVRDL
jgi:hypothetical protein